MRAGIYIPLIPQRPHRIDVPTRCHLSLFFCHALRVKKAAFKAQLKPLGTDAG